MTMTIAYTAALAILIAANAAIWYPALRQLPAALRRVNASGALVITLAPWRLALLSVAIAMLAAAAR